MEATTIWIGASPRFMTRLTETNLQTSSAQMASLGYLLAFSGG